MGIVGAGQLARMMCEAAGPLGIPVVVLAERPDDAAVPLATETLVGPPGDGTALRLLAGRARVVTFDHEQVDVDLLASLEAGGTIVRPGPGTLRMAVDKVAMRSRLAGAGVAVPAFAPVVEGDAIEMAAQVEKFASDHGWPLVLKAARGGYDGKGVWPVDGAPAALLVCERAAGAGLRLLVEERVPIDAELAVLVARRPGGEAATWPTVQTVQVDGICREVLLPGCLDAALASQAQALALEVADVAGSTGVMAVELFSARGRLLVNEVAARPHNTGHWTIEGAVTSQFENHLRTVLDLPVGRTEATAPAVASVNVLGAHGGWDPAGGLERALAVPGAHVHLYGKRPRPGRKLGHVTVCGADPAVVRTRAWEAAAALGTPVPPGIACPAGGGDLAGTTTGPRSGGSGGSR
ncbi:MAG: 5-(carboxyamino)imidazole ribonucleotide synthase [Acidimicrobiales bacterium]